MVRCIPTFVVLGLIASLTYTHPVRSIDDFEEVTETADIQSVEDGIEDIFATPILPEEVVEEEGIYSIDEPLEIVPRTAPFTLVDDVPTDDVEVQAVDVEEADDEDTAGVQAVEEEEVDDEDTAGVQAVEEEEEEDIVAGIQGVEDVEDVIEVADVEPTSTSDEVVAQADEDNAELEFELFEEGEEGDDETNTAGIINEEINNVQGNNNVPVPDLETAAKYQNLALEAINKLKILHIFRSKTLNKRDDDSDSESEIEAPPETEPQEENVEEPQEEENTEAPQETEIEEIPTESILDEAPTSIFEEVPKHKRDEEEDGVEIALFEVEEDAKNDFETVTEVVTDVHTDLEDIDDGNQPTIGAIALEPEQDVVEEEIPLFEDIEKIEEEEVQIAKKDNILIAFNYEVVVVEETTESPSEVVDEEPTIIN